MKALTELELKEKIINRSYPEPNTGCWLWGDSLNAFGYGILKASKIHKNMVTAHRVSYWVNKNPFDLSMHVLHKCDNPCCVNPDHLYLGTHQDNMNDRTKRNRTNRIAPKGSKCGASKLTEKDIKSIRIMACAFNQSQIADTYNVSQTTIHYILTRKTWKHI